MIIFCHTENDSEDESEGKNERNDADISSNEPVRHRLDGADCRRENSGTAAARGGEIFEKLYPGGKPVGRHWAKVT